MPPYAAQMTKLMTSPLHPTGHTAEIGKAALITGGRSRNGADTAVLMPQSRVFAATLRYVRPLACFDQAGDIAVEVFVSGIAGHKNISH